MLNHIFESIGKILEWSGGSDASKTVMDILANIFGKIEGKDMTEEAIKKKLKEIENTEKEKQQNKSKK